MTGPVARTPDSKPVAKTPSPDPSDDGPVPLFGTWRNAYGAVVICALLTLLALHFFEGWPF